MSSDLTRLRKTDQALCERLLAARDTHGRWRGRLASSALSTATAIIAFSEKARQSDPDQRPRGESSADRERCGRGADWLVQTQNSDGGWGDTDRSKSNIATTALVWAALASEHHRKSTQSSWSAAEARAAAWLKKAAGDTSPQAIRAAILARYGRDQTFSVPILTALAVCGRLGPGPEAWRMVPQLPFALAALPQGWFHRLNLPVVSYAIPALIAIGQVRHKHWPGWNPLARLLRSLALAPTRRLLRKVQPASGGYLEATPLTAFVCMSLLSAGASSDPEVAAVLQEGLRFLREQQREDGSWPIDSDLSTWLTSLSIKALFGEAGAPPDPLALQKLDHDQRDALIRFLLEQQTKAPHPYTAAAPGGWAWTDRPGGVPDGDDSSAAVLALEALRTRGPSKDLESPIQAAQQAGARWLMGLQNRDGGVATFCRGWSGLPFDLSNPDITAHALSAWSLIDSQSPSLQNARSQASKYLARAQRPDGSFIPLWFGNEHAPGDINPCYGTARVLIALRGIPKAPSEMTINAENWLLNSQNSDGAWSGIAGGPPSLEETALATQALSLSKNNPKALEAALRGAHWIAEKSYFGQETPATPIGFYFASLWYYEDLYPLIFCKAAFSALLGHSSIAGKFN